MTQFVDGPAVGQTLSLQRAPLFLRVTFNRTSHEWDALDQVTDRPRLDEDLHAYRREGEAGRMHVCRRGSGARAGSGWYAVATYKHVPLQPLADVLREQAKWEAWTVAQLRAAR